jgi:hypothetical protein
MVAAVPEEVLAKIVAEFPVGRLGKARRSPAASCSCAARMRLRHRLTLSINGGQHMY